MRSKTILSAAAFVIAFVFSTAFANLFVIKSVNVAVREPSVSRSNCRTKQQILDFLEQDRRYGRELSREIAANVHRNASRSIEETATLNLVRKMRRMDDSAMPSDFRAAWENHVRAWEDQADFLRDSNNRLQNEDFTEGYAERNGEISRTYYALLGVAREYDVNFSN